ncbi:RNA polymerase sigma factor [Chryseolinea lacunae]|uniref:Sigma-70 family RNA polymerase sigma factor n=1 Tax=Chryseolinea lacunae TaxID=2801331 RepID=A0ABS1KRJ8_9BACT|nr:sigma-70 family RNA polymerase sigma factor [Chryseolinea lacunae]MBL0742105.1 sigma-70 family RNA polymerase sigma factor [Chryseolinea lacunae]
MKKNQIDTSEHQIFQVFTSDSEHGLTLIYNRLSKPIQRYGLRLVQDEFTVNSIIQEAFLKMWVFRERMTSMDHIRRFLKLIVRWECMAYYRNSKLQFYRRLVSLDWFDTKAIDSFPEQDGVDSKSKFLNEVLLRIPSLPNHGQRRILDLHLCEGLTAKEISQRLKLPVQTVNKEIESACEYLRSLLVPKTSSSIYRRTSTEIRFYHDRLTTEQSHIYSMRLNLHYTFLQISELLKLPLPYVQQQYVKAHAILKEI